MSVPLNGFPDMPFYNLYFVGGPLDGQVSNGFRPYYRMVIEGNIYEVNSFADTTDPDDYVEWVDDGTRKITLYHKGEVKYNSKDTFSQSWSIGKPREMREPDKVYEFYDPHPGLAGCSVRIPEPIRLIANEISGSRMSLRQAVFLIRAATTGIVEAVEDMGMITLRIEESTGQIHSWRVIRFREN